MATFNWSIAQLERNTSDNGVVVAHWRCEGVDGDNSTGSYGTVSFTPDSSADDFIAFDDLTEADVIGWVKEALGGDEKVAEIEAQIQAKIDEQKNPPLVAEIPWGE